MEGPAIARPGSMEIRGTARPSSAALSPTTLAMAAASTAGVLGVSLRAAVERLETVEIAERWRMQPLGSDRVRIINDAYNASPDSMSAALRTLAQIT